MSTRRSGSRPSSLGGRPTPRLRRRNGAGAGEDSALALADRYYSAINARDLDTWVELLDEDVEVVVDAGVLRGRLGARAYLNGVLQACPGVIVVSRRVVAASRDAVVSEFRLANPMAAVAPNPAAPDDPALPWRLDGVTCEVLRLRDNRLVSLHSYYSPRPTDRTPTAEVPSRAEAARIANRQAALGQVATHAAGGGSERELVTVINQVIAELAGVDISLMMRFETGDTAMVLAASGWTDAPDLMGRRLLVDDNLRAVRHLGRALRVEGQDWPLRELLGGAVGGDDLRWCVAIPISLHGTVWGVSVLGSTSEETFTEGVEEGIAAFTQLVTSVLANARANDELRERAREQALLLEVAEIAAGGAEPAEVFAAITRSASALLDGVATMLLRFVDEQSADLLSVHGFDADIPPAGRRVTVDPDGVTAAVQHTGETARIDDYRRPPGNRLAQQVGICASVGVPVAVGGRSWGILLASSSENPLPAAAEHRLSLIAGTGAAAVAGAQARGELLALAEEQAALRRVAELVARGVGQDQIFAALTAEATGLIDEATTLIRFEQERSYTVVATSAGPQPVGTRIEIAAEEQGLVAKILRTRRPARIDAGERPGRIDGRQDGAEHGGTSAVGVPIMVGARLWGVLSASSTDRRLATTVEHGLLQFAGTMAAAVANGEARGQLQDLADEQAALRRVAELAARDAQPDEVLAVVAKESAVLAGVDFGMVLRYDDSDGGNRIVALDGAPAEFVLGMRAPGTGDGAVQRVWRSGRAARVDDLGTVGGRWPRMAHELGYTTSAGVPIIIGGQVWGALIVVGRHQGFPPDIEQHLTHFAKLAGTAIATMEARQKLRDLADEQAALRRIAELAAHEAPAEEVLGAVAVEASTLAGVDFTALLRFDPDGSTAIMALDGAPAGIVVGMRAPGTGDGATQRVWRTRRPARIDNLREMSGVWPKLAAANGFDASAAVPVVMHGRLWGVLVVVGRLAAFPPAIEEHLGNFADLAGTAVSAADARQELRLLADEQAAVRRVAELVARGATLDEVFTAVAAETSALVSDLPAVVVRFDQVAVEGAVVAAVAVARANDATPIGLPLTITANDDVLGELRRSGRAVRFDTVTTVVPAGFSTDLEVRGGVAVPITVEGHVWGALAVGTADPPLAAGLEERLTPFAELTAVAIANADNKSKLTASRARVIATADETRRRVQRDVHDGAQQRLVHTIIALKLARDAVEAGEPPGELLAEALSNAERASKELRDIVRGILPASLTRGGLRSGLESIVADLTLPVELRVRTPRLSAHIETTAYFIVAEAMTNVVKHAQASRAIVDVHIDGRTLVIEVSDDGIGGADAAGGSGLTGLLDRVEAGNGTFAVLSRPGTGTIIRATLPLENSLSGTT